MSEFATNLDGTALTMSLGRFAAMQLVVSLVQQLAGTSTDLAGVILQVEGGKALMTVGLATLFRQTSVAKPPGAVALEQGHRIREARIAGLRAATRVRLDGYAHPVWGGYGHEGLYDSWAAVPPEASFAWACEELTLALDADAWLEEMLEEADESAREAAAQSAPKLQQLLDLWCAAHPVRWWTPRNDLILILDEDRFLREYPELKGHKWK